MPTGKRDRDVGRIELGRGRTLAGVVVDAMGRPVANAEVVAGVVIDAARLVIAFPASAPTGPDGSFVVEHLSEQGGDLRAAARAHPGDRWIAAAGDGSAPVTITLPAGSSVDVKLTRTDGGIVPDAELSLRAQDGPPFLTWAPPSPLSADRVERVADGHLRMLGVTTGRYELLGRAPGLALARATFELRGALEPVQLEFSAARELGVAVLDRATRQPIEHAEVTVSLDERMVAPLVARRTDAIGHASLPNLPARNVRVRAWHPAYAPASQLVALESLPSGAAPLELLLGPGATLHGRVHHGGQPLTEPMLLVLSGRNGTPEDQNIDDEMPRFAVPGLDGTFTLRGLKPGQQRWELMPRLFGGDPQDALQKVAEISRAGAGKRGQVELKEGETTELDIDVDPANRGKPGRIRGIVRVKGGDGGDFRIGVHMQNEDVAPDQRQKTLQAHANQSFVVEDVKPGFVGITVDRAVEGTPEQNYGNTTLHQEWFELMDGEEHVLELDFEFVAAEAHVVDAAGAPVAGTSVEFTWRSESGGNFVSFQSLYAMTDAEGIARTDVPKRGPYTVKCLNPQRGRGSADAEFPSREPVTLRLDVGVPCAGRVEITPDPGNEAQVWISFVERRANGSVESVGWQQLEKGRREFEVVGLRPGSYSAQLFTGQGRLHECPFELGANGDDHLALRFKVQ